ncbi:unnamed protein product [Orchesella dallaii]|uniref:Uncharacterized protein n=1 Tax=Orchesella dallaii TaxID=48710 RepID=A0ABP1S4G6_9HEXA
MLKNVSQVFTSTHSGPAGTLRGVTWRARMIDGLVDIAHILGAGVLDANFTFRFSLHFYS